MSKLVFPKAACSLSLILITLLTASIAPAGSFKTIHIFQAWDATSVIANLTSDSNGNLYGASSAGGLQSTGTVFELIRPSAPRSDWTITVLYTFLGGTDGANPSGSVIFDKAGNLYGSTSHGGNADLGTVFELSPPLSGGGEWTHTVLWSFPPNGGNSPGGLVFGKGGVLYGMTAYGGLNGAGNIFSLSPPKTQGQPWKEKVLYTFSGGRDGQYPERFGAPLSFDGSGNLYGTTQYGGAYSAGTVFRLAHPNAPGGDWTQTVIYSFGSNPGDGTSPYGGLVFDRAGNLYGATYNHPTIFELSPPLDQSTPWTETILYTFSGLDDGSDIFSGPVFDRSGNLYGTAASDGQYNYGTVWELQPPTTPGGPWTAALLHSFKRGNDGAYPRAGLTVAPNGTLYGVTPDGGQGFGNNGYGTAFKLVP